MYLPLKTAKSLKEQAQPTMKLGTWLGVIERTEETIIGTKDGIVKCRTVNRILEDQRWNRDLLLGIKGTPWMPVPRVKGDHIPVEIKEDGSSTTPEEENIETGPEITFEEDVDMPNKPRTVGYKGAGMTEFHIKKPMVQKYGHIDSCPACQKLRNMSEGGRSLIGRLGVNRSVECKTRIMHKMRNDPIDPHIVEGYMKRAKGNQDVQDTQIQVPETKDTSANHDDDKTAKLLSLETTMTNMMRVSMDVAEVYSPERVTAMAKKMGLNAGWALDLTTTDAEGRAWDFECVHMRNKAVRMLLQDKPMLLIGSPMCTEYSSWNYINHPRMLVEVVQERFRRTRAHLQFCAKLYALQIQQGRYFLHEHPAGATAWNEKCIQSILGKHGVILVKAEQCQYGLMSTDGLGRGLVRKSIGFMTNAPCIAMQLQRRCPNKIGRRVHRHVTLEGGRTKPAQVYPDGLCRAI